jgi:hypothetical protein
MALNPNSLRKLTITEDMTYSKFMMELDRRANNGIKSEEPVMIYNNGTKIKPPRMKMLKKTPTMGNQSQNIKKLMEKIIFPDKARYKVDLEIMEKPGNICNWYTLNKCFSDGLANHEAYILTNESYVRRNSDIAKCDSIFENTKYGFIVNINKLNKLSKEKKYKNYTQNEIIKKEMEKLYEPLLKYTNDILLLDYGFCAITLKEVFVNFTKINKFSEMNKEYEGLNINEKQKNYFNSKLRNYISPGRYSISNEPISTSSVQTNVAPVILLQHSKTGERFIAMSHVANIYNLEALLEAVEIKKQEGYEIKQIITTTRGYGKSSKRDQILISIHKYAEKNQVKFVNYEFDVSSLWVWADPQRGSVTFGSDASDMEEDEKQAL